MAPYKNAAARSAALRGSLGAAASVALGLAIGPSAWADDPAPIKIGVIAEAQAVAGSSIPQAAQIAADMEELPLDVAALAHRQPRQ